MLNKVTESSSLNCCFRLVKKHFDFSVYPLLSKNGKMQWESIDRRFSDDELTLKGYEKKRRELFIEEHLKIGDAKELESSKKSNNEQPLQQNSAEKNSLNDYRLFGRTECIQVCFCRTILPGGTTRIPGLASPIPRGTSLIN